jgi:ATP-citrate lyase beta-subunit
VDCGLAYLEVNPFTFSGEDVICLDMVARIDSCEAFRQKEHWKSLIITNPFGVEKSEAEKYIDELDSQTGASLKFRILNPNGRIWLLTSGGGASVIIADTLADLGFTNEIGNYGECSGNPDRENTRAYADTLIRTMLANGKI